MKQPPTRTCDLHYGNFMIAQFIKKKVKSFKFFANRIISKIWPLLRDFADRALKKSTIKKRGKSTITPTLLGDDLSNEFETILTYLNLT